MRPTSLPRLVDFNKGVTIDGAQVEPPSQPFSFGVAGYPEKHAEAPNFKTDIDFLKRKVDMGAEYIITQLFYNNEHFYRFVDALARQASTYPLFPG